MSAPVCPISNGQLPEVIRRLRNGQALTGAPTPMPSIPNAYDLPSLIRTTNVIRDILRQLTTSLTVNNVYNPRPPFFKAQGNTYYSQYPEWDEKQVDSASGFVHGKKNPESRAYVLRINGVLFENRMQDDPPFRWSYPKPLSME